MGFNPLKKIAKGFKKLVTNPGKWAENAGRSVGAATRDFAKTVPLPVPGLNSALAAAGSIAAGGNMKDHFSAGLSAGIPGAIKHIPGVGSAISAVTNKIPGVQGINSLLGNVQGLPDSIVPMEENSGSGGGDLLHSAMDWLRGNSGKNALGLAQGFNSALQQQKSNQLAKRAVGNAEAEYNAAAPLRAAGLSTLLNPQASDTSALHDTVNRGNPYARPLSINRAMGG